MTIASDVLCTIDDLTKSFGSKKTPHRVVLDRINLELRRGEVLSIVGKSGCGKSTLLRIVAGILEPTSGAVTVSGERVTGPDSSRAMVGQVDSVFPWYTVEQNVEYAMRIKGTKAGKRASAARELLELVGIPDYARAFPSRLSAGMRKRVDVARAYAAQPEILLMDEAFGSLDVITKEQMQVDLSALLSVKKNACIFVTHDIEEAIFIGDRVAMMTPLDGHIAGIFTVPFPRPRERELKLSREFQDLRKEVTEAFYAAKLTRHSES